MRWKFTVCRKQSTIVDDVSFHRTLFPLSFAAVVVVCCPNILILRGIPRCVGAKAWRLGRKNTTPSQVAQGPPSPSSLSAITPVGGLAKTQVSMYMIERSRLQKNDEIADVIAWECPKLRVDHWEEKTGKLIVTEIGSTIAVATMKVGRRGRPKQDGRLGRFVASSSWKFVTLVQINFTQQLQVLRIPSFGCHFLRVMAITFLNFLSRAEFLAAVQVYIGDRMCQICLRSRMVCIFSEGISNLEKPGVRLAGGWRLWLVFGTGVATNI